MSTQQTKTLKKALKKVGINASVRTERNYIGRNPITGKKEYEYGKARAFVLDGLTQEQLETMREVNPYIKMTGVCTVVL